MNDEKKDKTPDELLKEFFDERELKNLDPKSLKHWSNIMTSIVALRKLRKKEPLNNSMGLWLMLVMMMLPIDLAPKNNPIMMNEDEANKPQL